jgi:pyrimidine operon attenuation protein / uracil phosphoribosyltransferase
MPRIPEPLLPASQKPKHLLDEKQLRRVVRRIAGEIVEHGGGTADLMLVGIRTRGVPFAERLAEEIAAMEDSKVARGILDITLYRDDLSTIAPQPVVKETSFQVPIDDRVVVLCDDVLYTGRTVRAALDALVDYGRPRAVRLAVVIDRGHRELPIQADFVGKTVQTDDQEVVEVRFEETDGHDGVHLMRRDWLEAAQRGSDAGEDA